MNYKKIISNQDLRLKILEFLQFIPDKFMIRLQYKIKTGRKLNLKNPKRYSEKIQWYKLNYRNPLLQICADKYLVRNFVENKGLGDILNELYGVYENPRDIDFEKLPEDFVIKLTSGSGGNILIKDKKKMNKQRIIHMLEDWQSNRPTRVAGEWAYNNDGRIIVEKYLKRDNNNDLPDYKFFCFNGKVKYLYVMIDYIDNHNEGKCSFFTTDFKKLPYRRSEYKPIEEEIEKPSNFDKMIKYAEKLSEDFPHVRVDFYNIDGDIVFGELTFYNASGYSDFKPDDFDYILGDQFQLPDLKEQ